MSKESLLAKFDSLEMNELHRAIQKNNLKAVEYLVEKGVDIRNTVNVGQTPLHLAVSLNYVFITSRLFTNKSREEARNLIDQRTVDTGTTALHLAAKKNSAANVRCLLSRGANFEIRDKENRQAKHLTTCRNILHLINYIELIFKYTLAIDSNVLLEKLKFCPNGLDLDSLAYARNSQGFTQLQLAMEKNHLNAVATIINYRIDRLRLDLWQAGAQIDNLMRHSKAARLHLSNLDAFCHEKSESMLDSNVKNEVVDLLRNAYEFLEAYKDGRDRSLEGQTLLIIIEESLEFFGSWEKSKFIENKRVDSLLGKGPFFAAQMLKLSIVAPMQFYMKLVYSTELLEAAKRNDLGKVEKCLIGHPDMDKRDDKDWTVLHYALNNQNMKMFKLLLNLGANPTSASEINGETLLHFLSRRNSNLLQRTINEVVLNTLSDHVSVDGVNAQTKGKRSSALHLAVEEGYLSLMQFLLARGAIYCAKDAHDKTPMDYCGSQNSTLLYLKTIDQLFAQVRDNKVEDSMQVIRKTKGNALLIYAGARDDKGRTLDQVLDIKRHCDEANEIRELLHKEKWRY